MGCKWGDPPKGKRPALVPLRSFSCTAHCSVSRSDMHRCNIALKQGELRPCIHDVHCNILTLCCNESDRERAIQDLIAMEHRKHALQPGMFC